MSSIRKCCFVYTRADFEARSILFGILVLVGSIDKDLFKFTYLYQLLKGIINGLVWRWHRGNISPDGFRKNLLKRTWLEYLLNFTNLSIGAHFSHVKGFHLSKNVLIRTLNSLILIIVQVKAIF